VSVPLLFLFVSETLILTPILGVLIVLLGLAGLTQTLLLSYVVEVILKEEFSHVGLLGTPEVSLFANVKLINVGVLLWVQTPTVLLRVVEGALETLETL
jgi:hypothetical protein